MRKSRLALPDEFETRERWQRRGTWCYRIAFALGVMLIIVAVITEGVPIVPEPHLGLIRRWMSTGFAAVMAIALCGFIFSRD